MNNELLKEHCLTIENRINNAMFQAAINTCTLMLRQFPKNHLGFYYLGVCYFALEEYEKALKNFNLALLINPVFSKAYFNLGTTYFMLKSFDKALINIGKALILFARIKDENSKERCIQAIKTIESIREESTEEN